MFTGQAKSLEQRKKVDAAERVRVNELEMDNKLEMETDNVRTLRQLKHKRKQTEQERNSKMFAMQKIGIHGKTLPQFHSSVKRNDGQGKNEQKDVGSKAIIDWWKQRSEIYYNPKVEHTSQRKL